MESNLKEIVEKYKNITEAYEIIKTVEIVKDRQLYRIEVIKNQNKNDECFEVRCWQYLNINIQPSYPKETKNGKDSYESPRKDIMMQVSLKVPALCAKSAEMALRMAIHYLSTGDIGIEYYINQIPKQAEIVSCHEE
jgi:hypothetical protein